MVYVSPANDVVNCMNLRNGYQASNIPLLVRRGGRDIKRMLRSLLIGADGLVAHTYSGLRATTQSAPLRMLREILLLAQPPLLTRRGISFPRKIYAF
jgi:hypothetical protein